MGQAVGESVESSLLVIHGSLWSALWANKHSVEFASHPAGEWSLYGGWSGQLGVFH